MKFTLSKVLLLVGGILLTSAIMVNNAQAAVITYSKATESVTIKLNKGVMKINVLRADIIEVNYTLLESVAQKQSLVVVNNLKNSSTFKITENAEEFIITTARLKVKVNNASNSIKYTDLKDVVILT